MTSKMTASPRTFFIDITWRLTLALSLIPMGATLAQADELRGILRNNQGVREFDKKLPFDAYKSFNSALADLPFAPEIHYNLGNSFLEHEEYEKALSEYEQALKYATGPSIRERSLRFHAYFNAGVADTALKKVDEALAQYQAALDLNPESIETKTNIELLAPQGGGGGKGDKDKDQDQKGQGDPKDGQNKDPKNQGKDQDKKDQQSQQKPTPRPFKGKELNQQDVNRILEELKRQENSIREKMQKEGPKDAPRDKDW